MTSWLAQVLTPISLPPSFGACYLVPVWTQLCIQDSGITPQAKILILHLCQRLMCWSSGFLLLTLGFPFCFHQHKYSVTPKLEKKGLRVLNYSVQLRSCSRTVSPNINTDNDILIHNVTMQLHYSEFSLQKTQPAFHPLPSKPSFWICSFHSPHLAKVSYKI